MKDICKLLDCSNGEILTAIADKLNLQYVRRETNEEHHPRIKGLELKWNDERVGKHYNMSGEGRIHYKKNGNQTVLHYVIMENPKRFKWAIMEYEDILGLAFPRDLKNIVLDYKDCDANWWNKQLMPDTPFPFEEELHSFYKFLSP